MQDPLPYLTGDLPGTGGQIKRHDEDFIVAELPLYAPCGEGTHVYFQVEKRGLTTPAAVARIAKALDKPARDIGYAGLKDAHGVTRQTLSVEHVDPERVKALQIGRIQISSVARHTNKLKLGHLRGNAFEIKVRDTITSPVDRAQCILDRLTARGVPNYFGPQRFGARGDNALVGRAALRGDFDEALAWILGRPTSVDRGAVRQARELFDAGQLEAAADAWPREFSQQAGVCRVMLQGGAAKAWRRIDRSLRRLFISSVQSDLFNRVLAARIDGIDRLQTGDVAWKHRNGASFLVTDAAAEQPRCDALEISPTGPLFGRKMMEAHDMPGAEEARVLADSGLTKTLFRNLPGIRLDGERRPLRVPLDSSTAEAGCDERGAYLHLAFELPAGSYATNVTREVCKTP